MECNKDEAVRTMQEAEKRLHDSDFVGARRIAQMAQRLNLKLENINQLLAVAEVHCSSQTTITGLGCDWYEILQLQPIADQETIRKQYKKLALLLHPDKNKFYGAKATFKMVGEDNELLTDQTKRAIYDENLSECRKTNGNETIQKQKEDFNSSQNVGSRKMSREETQSFNDCVDLLKNCVDLVNKYRLKLTKRAFSKSACLSFKNAIVSLKRITPVSRRRSSSLLENSFQKLSEFGKMVDADD